MTCFATCFMTGHFDHAVAAQFDKKPPHPLIVPAPRGTDMPKRMRQLPAADRYDLAARPDARRFECGILDQPHPRLTARKRLRFVSLENWIVHPATVHQVESVRLGQCTHPKTCLRPARQD